jgi:hypothetical protein
MSKKIPGGCARIHVGGISMLIDPYQTNWQSELLDRYRLLPAGARLVLLIDGAFVPGLFRQVGIASRSVLLFEWLPGCSDDVRDVSPFLVQFEPDDRALYRVLERCNGLPMLSFIVTYESMDELGERLAAWCIVETGQDRFNFRFPDTRRLPAIFDALTPQQRCELVGNALGWHYMARNGAWAALRIDCGGAVAGIAAKAKLSSAQFARLVEDSEADEVWVRLRHGGASWGKMPSQRHELLTQAVQVARQHGLDSSATFNWCSRLIDKIGTDTDIILAQAFLNWKKEWAGLLDEELQNTV